MSVYRTTGPLVILLYMRTIELSINAKAHGELIVYQSIRRLCVCVSAC